MGLQPHAGRPGYASTTIDFYVYQSGLVQGQLGVASAASVVGIVVIAILLPLATLRRRRASRTGTQGARLLRMAIVALAALAVIVPLLWALRVSLRPVDAWIGDPAGLGGGLTLENFSNA